jgi:hypothetical protein
LNARRKGSDEAVPPDFFLAGYPDEIHVAADRLRGVVKAAVPDAVERVRPGWKIIGYDLPIGRRTVYFAWVMPETVHVHLGFPKGVFLADPDRRLEGAHLRLRTTRFVTFEPRDAIPRQALIRLTKEAARVAAMPRAERLALVLDRDWPPDSVVQVSGGGVSEVSSRSRRP